MQMQIINRAKSKSKWHKVILQSVRPTQDEPVNEELAQFRCIGDAHEWAIQIIQRPEFNTPLPPFINSRQIIIL